MQRDGRLSDAGRARKVAALDDEILELCGPLWAADLPPLEGPDNDYRLLVNEVMRLMLARQLFTFVTAEPVEQPNGDSQPVAGTNNEAERTLRASGPSPQDGPHQQDAGRCPPANDSDQRAGIAASVPADVHAGERACGDRSLVEKGEAASRNS